MSTIYDSAPSPELYRRIAELEQACSVLSARLRDVESRLSAPLEDIDLSISTPAQITGHTTGLGGESNAAVKVKRVLADGTLDSVEITAYVESVPLSGTGLGTLNLVGDGVVSLGTFPSTEVGQYVTIRRKRFPRVGADSYRLEWVLENDRYHPACP